MANSEECPIAICYVCDKSFQLQSLVGGKCVCDKCYPIWFKGLMEGKQDSLAENEKLEEYQLIANDYQEYKPENCNDYGDIIGTPGSLEEYIEDLHEKIEKLKKENKSLIEYIEME
jgi:hypothetical protein